MVSAASLALTFSY